MCEFKRMWINQPSTLQTYHSLHGKRVFATHLKDGKLTTIYFLEGPIVSQMIDPIALSEGWPTKE